jgi:hypothetical protein
MNRIRPSGRREIGFILRYEEDGWAAMESQRYAGANHGPVTRHHQDIHG